MIKLSRIFLLFIHTSLEHVSNYANKFMEADDTEI